MILTSLLKKGNSLRRAKTDIYKTYPPYKGQSWKKNDIKGENSMIEKELSSKRKTYRKHAEWAGGQLMCQTG